MPYEITVSYNPELEKQIIQLRYSTFETSKEFDKWYTDFHEKNTQQLKDRRSSGGLCWTYKNGNEVSTWKYRFWPKKEK